MSDKYAIISLGGKQYKVSEGSTLRVERQTAPVVEVLAYSQGNSVRVGTPILADIFVNVEVTGETKEKTLIKRFRAKSRHRRRMGHKQPMSLLKIVSIGDKSESKPEKATELTEVTKTATSEAKKSIKPATKKATPKTTVAKEKKTVSKKGSSKPTE